MQMHEVALAWGAIERRRMCADEYAFVTFRIEPDDIHGFVLQREALLRRPKQRLGDRLSAGSIDVDVPDESAGAP